MLRLICTLCQSVQSNTSTLSMQLGVKCRDLSVRSTNQQNATNPLWGCNLRSNAEHSWIFMINKMSLAVTQLGRLLVYIELQTDLWLDQFVLSVNMYFCYLALILSHKSLPNCSWSAMAHYVCRLSPAVRDLSVCSANQWKATHPSWVWNSRSNAKIFFLLSTEKMTILMKWLTYDQMKNRLKLSKLNK